MTAEQTIAKEFKQMRSLRMQLHLEVGQRLQILGYSPKSSLINKIKHHFIWNVYQRETSRAMSLEELQDAIERVDSIPDDFIREKLEREEVAYQERRHKKCTGQQIRKITRIMKYVIGLNLNESKKYIAKTIGRRCALRNLTIQEADSIIKRLEEWEYKILLKSKSNLSTSSTNIH